jgi:hypothetical protein
VVEASIRFLFEGLIFSAIKMARRFVCFLSGGPAAANISVAVSSTVKQFEGIATSKEQNSWGTMQRRMDHPEPIIVGP